LFVCGCGYPSIGCFIRPTLMLTKLVAVRVVLASQSALAIAKFDAEEFDDSPTMLRIVEMLESAALGEWDEQKEEFRRRLGATGEDEDE
jgi:hypothetical protein